jgi:toxin-antitoxin system PIN domain toxin
MILLDANILIYTYDLDSPHHGTARRWLKEQVQASETIGLPWISLWAFLRITTNPRIHQSPFPLAEAFRILREILQIPRAVVVQPGPDHVEILERMASTGQISGSRLTDASLAALAVEHGAVLASTDRDFARFPGLKWINPLD